MADFSMSFDQRSLAEIAAFAGFGVLLSSEVQAAMHEGGTLLADAAIANTWANFKNPTGQLAGTITPLQQSSYEIIVGSDDPKARRREFGFSGKTDSLGRTYTNDPGIFYLTNAMNDNQQRVLQLIDAAVERAMAQLGR